MVKSTEGSAWNVPVTTVDAQVGDAGVSGRVWEVSPFLVIDDTHPFWVTGKP